VYDSIVHNPRRRADGIDEIIIRWPPKDPNFAAEYPKAASEEEGEPGDLPPGLCTCKVFLKKCFGASHPVTQRSGGTNTRIAANDARKVFHRSGYFPQILIYKNGKSRRNIHLVSGFWMRASGIFHLPSLFCGFLKPDNLAASSTECVLASVILGPGVLFP
jgi:hypothetical protein